MDNKKKLSDILNTYSINELKNMIKYINDNMAIKGYSKITKKSELVNFLVNNHYEKFKNVKSKKEFKILNENIKTDEQFKKYKEVIQNFDLLNTFINNQVAKLYGAKSQKVALLNYYIKQGRPLPENASPELKKLYKAELEKFKKSSDKRFKKLENKKEVKTENKKVNKNNEEINKFINSMKEENKLMVGLVDTLISQGVKTPPSMLDDELKKLFLLKIKK